MELIGSISQCTGRGCIVRLAVRDMVLGHEALDPLLHRGIVAVHRGPLMPFFSVGAWLEVAEGRKAADSVAIGCVAVISAIDLEELDFITVFSLELVIDLVPRGHELDAPAASWHEKVDDNQLIATIIFVDLILEVFLSVGHVTMCLFVPVEIHRVSACVVV